MFNRLESEPSISEDMSKHSNEILGTFGVG
jgi:hypothetical protein